jgi:hypothetical protein
MKALRLFALLLIVVGVVGSASAHSSALNGGGLICGSSTDPTLCDQTTGEDLLCTDFCGQQCTGFTDVTANCVPKFGGGYRCVCHGTPIP